ncbi:MAG: hypothetical protein PHX88_11830 [Methanoculleus horonobensis]|jgi:hypothetical protein|nr:hypothetical protein [Methanoculleus horonobensis]
MPAVTVTGVGGDCVVVSTFAGPLAHARALAFLRRLPLARPAVREDGRPVAGFAFRALARQQAATRDAVRQRQDAGMIIC